MENKLKANGTKTFYGHLCNKRNDAAKVFPHCGQDATAYVKRVQGVKLSAYSVKALGRA